MLIIFTVLGLFIFLPALFDYQYAVEDLDFSYYDDLRKSISNDRWGEDNTYIEPVSVRIKCYLINYYVSTGRRARYRADDTGVIDASETAIMMFYAGPDNYEYGYLELADKKYVEYFKTEEVSNHSFIEDTDDFFYHKPVVYFRCYEYYADYTNGKFIPVELEIYNEHLEPTGVVLHFTPENTDGYTKNPARKTKLPTTAPKETRRALTAKEIEWVINTEHRGRLPAIIMTFCGLRAGELIPLEWNDIDFDGCSMYIGKSVKKIDNNTYEIKYATKNGKTRTIPIPPNVMEELKKYRDTSPTSFICSQTDGSMHTPSSWRKLWDSYNNNLSHLYASFVQAGKSKYDPKGIKKKVDRITPHYFRHTFATLLYTSGVDPLTAQKLLGHSHISTTLAIYTHLENEKVVVSVEKYEIYIKKYWRISHENE